MNDSPVGLAAYILEKFSTWSNKQNRDLQDGALERWVFSNATALGGAGGRNAIWQPEGWSFEPGSAWPHQSVFAQDAEPQTVPAE